MAIARDSGSVVRYIEFITSYYLNQRRKPCSVIDNYTTSFPANNLRNVYLINILLLRQPQDVVVVHVCVLNFVEELILCVIIFSHTINAKNDYPSKLDK